MIVSNVKGDLIKEARKYDAIVHGCNCFHMMGAGIAIAVATTFPEAVKADKATPITKDKLGTFSYTEVIDSTTRQSLFVINAYTQYYPGKHAKLDAIRNAFQKINDFLKGIGKTSVGIPLIGCGIGGLKWSDVEAAINEVTPDLQITLVIYEP